jgi:hypothetical protein
MALPGAHVVPMFEAAFDRKESECTFNIIRRRMIEVLKDLRGRHDSAMRGSVPDGCDPAHKFDVLGFLKHP